MKQYTELLQVKITPTQAATLDKLRKRKIRVGNFVREAIKEKIIREYGQLQEKEKHQECPF
jgi:hypothetical protein